MLLLLKLSRRVCDKGDIEFNIEKYKYVVFGKKKFDNTIFLNSIINTVIDFFSLWFEISSFRI